MAKTKAHFTKGEWVTLDVGDDKKEMCVYQHPIYSQTDKLIAHAVLYKGKEHVANKGAVRKVKT